MSTVQIIAEAGVNHNGDPALALALVETAARAGADFVKFQTFRADRLVTPAAPKAAYQARATDHSSQHEMLRRLELSEDLHRELICRARTSGIEFLSTPFDEESLRFLSDGLNLSRIKLGSGEITNAPLLLASARTGKPVILSTGMSTLGEVEDALGVLAFGYLSPSGVKPGRVAFRRAFAADDGQRALREKVTLLHCTTEYPAAFSEVNLKAMETLRRAFGVPVGYSDHTEGISVSLAAVALGATVIEKHFTLDRSLPGPDHPASLDPHGLTGLVRGIREVENALGDGIKRPRPAELGNLPIARKSLVALTRIKQGEIFSTENLGAKRPGLGTSPLDYWEWEGKPAPRDYEPNDVI